MESRLAGKAAVSSSRPVRSRAAAVWVSRWVSTPPTTPLTVLVMLVLVWWGLVVVTSRVGCVMVVVAILFSANGYGGRTRRAGWMDKTVMGRLGLQAPMRSHHPAR